MGERSRRCLLPLLFGVLVVVPTRAWWEVGHKLGLAAASWLLVPAYFDPYRQQDPPEALRWLQRVLYGAMQWWRLVAVLGWARQPLDHGHRWPAGLTRAVFCVCLLHVPGLRQAPGAPPAPPAARAAGRQPGTCASTSRASSASDCCQPT